MRPRAFGIFVALLVLLDVTLRTGLGVGGLFTPDLIAVAVLLTARRSTVVRTVVLGLGLGLLDDAMGIGNLGARSLALGAVAVVGTWTRQIVEGEGPLLIVPYLFVGAWLVNAIKTVVAPGGVSVTARADLLAAAPIEALVTAVAGTAALVVFRVVAGRDA